MIVHAPGIAREIMAQEWPELVAVAEWRGYFTDLSDQMAADSARAGGRNACTTTISELDADSAGRDSEVVPTDSEGDE